jgi:hypothetical protein
MPDDETDELIEQMADAAVRLINSNLALVKRVAEGGSRSVEPDEQAGPVQDAWMTWADCAGDVVTISYLAANLADVVCGSHRPKAPET